MNSVHITDNTSVVLATSTLGANVGSGAGRRLCFSIRGPENDGTGGTLGGGTAMLCYRPDSSVTAVTIPFAEWSALALRTQYQIAWVAADIVFVLTGATAPDFYIDYASGN
jgi:hypothetical protein